MFEETHVHNLQRKMSGFLASFSCKMCQSGELDRSGTVRAAPCAVTLRVQSMLQPPSSIKFLPVEQTRSAVVLIGRE